MKRLSSIFSLGLVLLVISCGGGESAGIIYFDSAKTKKWKETINGKFTHLKNKTKFYQEGKNLLNEILNYKTNWLIEF